MNTARKPGPNTNTDRGTSPGVGLWIYYTSRYTTGIHQNSCAALCSGSWPDCCPRACVPVHEVLGHGTQTVARNGARCASQVHNRVAQADARGAAQVLDRGAQAVARGVAQVLDRGAQALARGTARCASQVLDRCAQAFARGASRYASQVLGRCLRRRSLCVAGT
jgi:hypothetical protein